MPDVTVYSGNSFPQATTLGRSPGENSAEKGLKSDSPEPDPVRTPGPLHPSGLPQGLTDRRGQRHGSFAFSETDQGGGTGTAPAVVVVGPEPSPLRAPGGEGWVPVSWAALGPTGPHAVETPQWKTPSAGMPSEWDLSLHVLRFLKGSAILPHSLPHWSYPRQGTFAGCCLSLYPPI